ncbi:MULTISPECIES: Fe(3+) ABC transporter substrate-binding protein [Arcobacter]|jgi:iron(III) transport system substrate-binding protein|uniref:Fe(3+) ABC transporter substrate-binding protein n=1 Tax=Arcobacter ellisii TaxID=913109 RepID=A0A347UB74_9BACT|nr:Fe(3+) ABC transporter substrate-binding protein [Arcobacter ellisii]AXX96102.1 iron(III)/spermidine/putrescine ABC transporter, periplasmic substrate-binding protein [Arcobacter ellisii]MBD3830250.1 Fe(3+) ABC transporter substrate-binding protein [Arcobacter sp.]RXI32050.1 Fe(3+) ABC transporter substrate-binding protein [Arcobacter ellisii]
MIKKIALSVVVLASSLFAANEVNVYSQRHYDSDKILFKEFEEKTGIKVNVVTAKAEELVSKLAIEGANTPADVLITADIGNLYDAKVRKLLQPIKSKTLEENIPSNLRDPDNNWFALTKRARVFVYNPKTVNPADLSDYLSLADPKFKNKVITRSSTSAYNKSLLASIVANNGEEKALAFAKGLVSNLPYSPKGGDRDQIRAVAAGDADIAIVNTYYLGVMLNSEDKKDSEIAKSLKIFFPAQNTTGTHMNISGGGVTNFASNKENAIKLLEFLSSVKAQEIFAEANQEFPANPNAKSSETVSSWGKFKEDTISLNEVGKYTRKAVEIATEADWK